MTNMRESHADARCETDRLRRVLARLRELHHFAWWAHSIYALGLGTAVAVFARKGYDHAPWVIALACAAWFLMLVFFRHFGTGAPQRSGNRRRVLTFYMMTYVLKNLYQGMLFFSLPFYWSSTTWGSPNQWSTIALTGCAVLSTIDVVFDRVLMRSKLAASLFFLLVLFSCTNLVFPAVFPDARTGVPLVVAAIVAWVGFWSVHVSSSATFEPRLLVAFLLGLTLVSVGAHLSRTVIPPAPLSLASAGVGPRLLSDGVLALAVTRIHPSELHELHAVTEVTVLDGRGEGLLHEWRCEGVLIARNPVTPIRVREHGGRVRLWSSLDQSQLPVRAEGSWTLTVLTPDERPIGRVVFEVLADP